MSIRLNEGVDSVQSWLPASMKLVARHPVCCKPQAVVPIRKRLNQLLIVLAGIVLGQVFIYGPSLLGEKILLPLDVLQRPGVYLPVDTASSKSPPQNPVLSDLIYFEPIRQFCASEFAAGREPLWNPFQLGGITCTIARFAPFSFQYWFQTPVVIAWAQLLSAIIAGTGMYAFCRRVVNVRYWVAALVSWIYPLTGFFVFWQVYATSKPICWLPWLVLGLHSCLRGGSWLALAGIAVVSCFTLTSGNPDVGGQVLLVGVVFGIWCLAENRTNRLLRARFVHSAGAILAVALGITMASDFLLPYLEHVQSGTRIARRVQGKEERPPRGTFDAPQILVPDIYGTMRSDSQRLVPYNQMESSAAAYCGFFSVMFLAPLAFCSHRHRSLAWFMAFLALFGLSWSLNVPGFVHLLRLPGLNVLSHGRLVFAAAFALLALAAIGFEALLSRQVSWSGWFCLPMALTAAAGLWCLFRLVVLPAEISTAAAQSIQSGFHITYLSGLILAALTGTAWWLLRREKLHPALSLPMIGALLIVEIGWFAHGRSVQCNSDLYYPPIPALQRLLAAPEGRVIGFGCLPPSLATTARLHDVRGYDGVDPVRYVDLLLLSQSAQSSSPPYALTHRLLPDFTLAGNSEIHLHPVLDLLGVRYVIFRGSPPDTFRPAFQSPDYWVAENPSALPRAFIPESIVRVDDPKARLSKLASHDFNPHKVGYVETDLHLPPICRGHAKVLEALPAKITLHAEMETAGVLVLTDRWDPGWQAYVNGIPKPSAIVDHALRGVALAPGQSTVEFRYESAALALGRALSTAAAILVAIWFVGLLAWNRYMRSRPASDATTIPESEITAAEK